MAIRVALTLALGLVLVPCSWAQTVRFDTNVGNIDLILNPTANPNLKIHVENILNYVESGRYEQVVINRADNGINPNDPSDDFVMQFGGFTTDSPLYTSFNDFNTVPSFDPVIVDVDGDGQVDFNTENLSNLRGTVSLALSNNPNTGTTSFFANLGDNEFLNGSGFVPFARIADMSTVDYILSLNQQSEQAAGLASSNIPVMGANDDMLVYVQRAFVLDPNPFVPEPEPSMMELATLLAGDDGNGGSDLGGGISEGGIGSGGGGAATIVSIPEPPALVLVVGAFMFYAVLKGPRRN